MYMSYCRFEGTRGELGVCINEVIDHMNGDAEYRVSDEEIAHFRGMVTDFFNMLQETGIIDPYCDIDEDALDGVCEKMKTGFEEE